MAEGRNNLPNFILDEEVLELGQAGLGSLRIGRIAELSGFGQMLDGMKSIHNLGTTWEEVGSQRPDPRGTIGGDRHMAGIRHLLLDG